MNRESRKEYTHIINLGAVKCIAAIICFSLSALFLAAETVEHEDPSPAASSVDELLAIRGEPGFFKALTEAYRSMNDPLKALDLMATFLPVLDGDAERHTLLLDMARLEEQTGRLQKAQLHYQSAVFTGQLTRDYRALFHSMLILIELGDYEYAMVQAQHIIGNSEDGGLRRQATAQKARIQQLEGKQVEALQTAQQLYNERKSLPADVLYSLWILYRSVPGESDYSSYAVAVEAELSERFPDSPEYGLITRENSPALTVENALGLRSVVTTNSEAEVPRDGLDSSGPQNSTNAERPPELEKSTAIQTGSFRDAENARYMQRTLEEEGFTALVTQAKVGEAIYYRVLVPIPFGGSEERIILELKEKGFEGYPVY
jgi:tetratricopeptide (TPR) repeat protein